MGVFLSRLQLERSQSDGIGLETVVQSDFLIEDTVAADGINGTQLAAERINDVGVVVPSADAQCLLAVEIAVRVRGLEIGEAKNAFVNDGQSVGHALLVGLAHLHLNLLVRVGRFGHLEIGLQLQILLLHLHRHHAIQTNRHVVGGIMWLNQSDIDIHIRNHLLRSCDFRLALLTEIFDQHGLQNPVVGLDGYECLGLVVGREFDDHFLAHLIAVGSGFHGQLRRRTRSGRRMSIAPIETDDFGELMATLLVVHHKEVTAPFFIRDVESDGSRAVAGQGAVLHGSLVSA